MKRGKTAVAVLAIGTMLVALPACQKQEGPGERAGKDADRAMDRVGKSIEKAGDNIQDAAKGNPK